ncbi:MAG TPA: biotin/lipoyl-containing protein, partial [Allosphingosinicella sp.]|nr:biotin/lipoyl-containing protein [Allosphingosinicella sp.]
MARFEFKLPDIGEGIAEAEIVAWHVKVGDRLEEDGRLADMMTDKATVEMESPVSGTVLEVAGALPHRRRGLRPGLRLRAPFAFAAVG